MSTKADEQKEMEDASPFPQICIESQDPGPKPTNVESQQEYIQIDQNGQGVPKDGDPPKAVHHSVHMKMDSPNSK